jgi:hypothetical protein
LEELVIIEDEDILDVKYTQTLDEIELEILTKKVEIMKSRLQKLEKVKIESS